jgi:DNA-binding Xre family transcriptional regulator
LQCANHLNLAGGTFRVSAGSSLLEGRLSATDNPMLSAIGSGTRFVGTGDVDAGGAAFEAVDGATLSLPRLISYSKGTGCAFVNWRARGTDSVLELDGLATVTGATCANLNIHATDGGQILLPQLTTVLDGILSILADGADSRIDLSALQESLAVSRTVGFEARNGGTIAMPLFAGGATVTVTLRTGGNLPVSLLNRLAGFTIEELAVDFSALTNLTSGSVLVSGGAMVSIPALVSHSNGPGCVVNTWRASGPGSVLDLSRLTQLSGSTCGSLGLQAIDGGTVLLDQLPAITEGTLNVLADGADSMVVLDTLENSVATLRAVTFEARNGGTVRIPRLTGGPTVAVALRSEGVLPVAQLTRLGGVRVSGMTVDFPALTNLIRADLSIDGGAVVTLPILTRHEQGSGCSVNFWEVSGSGSVLDLSSLQHLTGSDCGYLTVQAMAGGTIVLDQLPELAEGSLNFVADGTNSLVDLGALRESQAILRPVAFEARNAGTIRVPLLAGGPTVTVAIRSGGAVSVEQMRLLRGLSVSETTLDLVEMTQFFTGNLTVGEGAVLRLPGLAHHDQGTGCAVNTWTVSGAGSVLDLSSLTNLLGGRCGSLELEASDGGTIDLRRLASITEGTVRILADGSDSRIELDVLENFLSPSATSRVMITNGGTLRLNESATIFSGVEIAVATNTVGSLMKFELYKDCCCPAICRRNGSDVVTSSSLSKCRTIAPISHLRGL